MPPHLVSQAIDQLDLCAGLLPLQPLPLELLLLPAHVHDAQHQLQGHEHSNYTDTGPGGATAPPGPPFQNEGSCLDFIT